MGKAAVAILDRYTNNDFIRSGGRSIIAMALMNTATRTLHNCTKIIFVVSTIPVVVAALFSLLITVWGLADSLSSSHSALDFYKPFVALFYIIWKIAAYPVCFCVLSAINFTLFRFLCSKALDVTALCVGGAVLIGSLPIARLAFYQIRNLGPTGVDQASYRKLSASYQIDKSHVYCSGSVMAGADPKTFSIFRGNGFDFQYARDKSHVYTDCKKIIGADPLTFVPLGKSMYAVDHFSAYYDGKKIGAADISTFRPLGDYTYAKDKNHVYAYGMIIVGADPGSFVVGPRRICGDGCSYDASDNIHKYNSGKCVK